MDPNKIEDVSDKLWKEANPDTKMDTPNMVYIHVENHKKEWLESDGELSLCDFIKKYKWNK